MAGVYCIQAHPGAGHHFLLSLVRHIYKQEQACIDFNGSGNSHQYAFKYWKLTNEPLLRLTTPRHEWPYKYRLGNPNSGEPLIVFYQTHLDQDIDFNRLNEIHPNIRYLFVNLDESELPLLEANHVLKQHRQADQNTSYVQAYMKLYESIKNDEPLLRKDVSKLVDFTPAEFEILIKNNIKTPHLIQQFKYMMDRCLPPPEIHGKLYRIDYKDIIYDKEKVVSTIESMVEKQRTPFTMESYDTYLRFHHKILDDFAPWLQPK